jgi:hypothetical protein
MVAAVFVSLNEEDTTKSNQLKAADIVERILNAKTLNGLLSIFKMNVAVSRKDDALKVRPKIITFVCSLIKSILILRSFQFWWTGAQ